MDEKFILESISKDANMFKMIPDELKSDLNFIFKALGVNGEIYQFIDEKLKQEPGLALQAITCNPQAIKYIDSNQKYYNQLAKVAVSLDSKSFKYVDKNKQDKEMILSVLANEALFPWINSYMNESYRDDKDVMVYGLLYKLHDISYDKKYYLHPEAEIDIIPSEYTNDSEFARALANAYNNNPASVQKHWFDRAINKLSDESKKIINDNLKEKSFKSDNLEKLHQSLLTTKNKYSINNVVDALNTKESKFVTGDNNAREVFESLSKEDIDKEILKYAVKFAKYNYENHEYRLTPSQSNAVNLLYLGACTNNGQIIDNMLTDEKMFKEYVDIFITRFSNDKIDFAFSEDSDIINNINNCFDKKNEKNIESTNDIISNKTEQTIIEEPKEEIKLDSALSKIDYALAITNKKYGGNQVVDVLTEHNSLKVTGDKNAREVFEELSKEDIDKEMMKGALRLVEYQKEQFQNFKENPENPDYYNRFMNVGRELYLAVNEQKDLSDFVNDEEKRKGMAELFTLRYSMPEHKDDIDTIIDDKDPRLQQIDNCFKHQQEQNMINSPKTIH